jgi:hypothetical protein
MTDEWCIFTAFLKTLIYCNGYQGGRARTCSREIFTVDRGTGNNDVVDDAEGTFASNIVTIAVLDVTVLED